MNKTILATLALGAAALTSCVYDPYAGAPGGPPPYHQPGYGANAYNDGYRDGYRDGQHDNRNGRPYNPSRQYSYAPALREQYRAGYASGYRHSGGGSAERNYAREGFRHGQQDRRNGLAYNPSRHFGSIPGYAREDFKRGYSRGWENGR